MASNLSDQRAQARTLPTAVNHGDEWGQEDLDMLVQFSDETAEEIARAIGRTVYAVRSMRELLADGSRTGRNAGRRKPANEPFFQFSSGWQDRMLSSSL